MAEMTENSDQSEKLSSDQQASINRRLHFTRLLDQPHFIAERAARYLKVSLQTPHRVLSTSDIEGGENTHIRYLVNHQSMEAVNDNQRMEYILSRSDHRYHRELAQDLGLVPEQMALMGTAANMNHVAHAHASFRELRVDVFVTAGVSGNAMRAGDEARWYQSDEGNQFVGSNGTINTIVLINRAMTAGAQAKAAMVMVEAKTAALMELAIASKQSSHLATGTGTDQFILASPLNNTATENSSKPLTSASGHLKLGELIGTAVRTATLESLRWQNALEASATGNLLHALSRFGITQAGIEAAALTVPFPLLGQQYTRFVDNLGSVMGEPRVVASAYAMAAVLDRFQYQSLPMFVANESLRDQAATMAVSVCGDTTQWRQFWQDLNVAPLSNSDRQFDRDGENHMTAFITQALLLGWQCKWR